VNDKPLDPSTHLNPHTDPRGRCRYCGRQQPYHSVMCRSLAAWWTGKAAGILAASSPEWRLATRQAAHRDAGSSSTGRGVAVSRTWWLNGLPITVSRRLTLRRSGVGSRRTPSINGTATTKTPDLSPLSPLGDATIGTVGHTPAKWVHPSSCPICRGPNRAGTEEQ
jgi:hypothetical protein